VPRRQQPKYTEAEIIAMMESNFTLKRTRKQPTGETKEKISQSLKGRKLSSETISKMDASNAATRVRKNKAKFAGYQSRQE